MTRIATQRYYKNSRQTCIATRRGPDVEQDRRRTVLVLVCLSFSQLHRQHKNIKERAEISHGTAGTQVQMLIDVKFSSFTRGLLKTRGINILGEKPLCSYIMKTRITKRKEKEKISKRRHEN